MFDIIFNPTSGKTKSTKALKRVEEIFTRQNVPYTVHVTKYPQHATEIASNLTKSGNCNLLVLGGDGTFNEVLNGIVCFDNVKVGLIPCGTGNDFVRATTLSTNVDEAVQTVLCGNVECVDFIQIDDKRALNCAGAGMDVDTLVKYAQMKHFKGKIKYYLALLSVLIKLKFHKATITTDDQQIHTSIFMVAIGNGTCIGGGMPVSPLSNVQDGLLNVVIINELPRRKVLGALLKFLKGKHLSLPCVQHFLTKKVTLQILDDGKTEIDGEVQNQQTLNCQVVTGKLQLYYNKGETK